MLCCCYSFTHHKVKEQQQKIMIEKNKHYHVIANKTCTIYLKECVWWTKIMILGIEESTTSHYQLHFKLITAKQLSWTKVSIKSSNILLANFIKKIIIKWKNSTIKSCRGKWNTKVKMVYFDKKKSMFSWA